MRSAGIEFAMIGLVSLKQDWNIANQRIYRVVEGATTPGKNVYFLIRVTFTMVGTTRFVLANSYATYKTYKCSSMFMLGRDGRPAAVLATHFEHAPTYRQYSLDVIEQYTDSLE